MSFGESWEQKEAQRLDATWSEKKIYSIEFLFANLYWNVMNSSISEVVNNERWRVDNLQQQCAKKIVVKARRSFAVYGKAYIDV